MNSININEIIAKNEMLDLSSFNLLPFNDTQVDEINFIYNTLDRIDKTVDKRVNIEEKKKRCANNLFNLLVEHLDMSQLKLKFDKIDIFDSENDDNVIYFTNLNQNTDEFICDLTSKCIKKYLMKISSEGNLVDKDLYAAIRLGLRNNDNKINDAYINYIIKALYEYTDLDLSKVKCNRITKEDLNTALNTYKTNNEKDMQKVRTYTLLDYLAPGQIRKVFEMFASTNFNGLSKMDKINMMNLVYNYFSINRFDKFIDFKKAIKVNTNNIDALNIVVNNLILKESDNTFNTFRNLKKLEDFKTGFKYIIKNDLNLDEVKKLDTISIKKDNER